MIVVLILRDAYLFVHEVDFAIAHSSMDEQQNVRKLTILLPFYGNRVKWSNKTNGQATHPNTRNRIEFCIKIETNRCVLLQH